MKEKKQVTKTHKFYKKKPFIFFLCMFNFVGFLSLTLALLFEVYVLISTGGVNSFGLEYLITITCCTFCLKEALVS